MPTATPTSLLRPDVLAGLTVVADGRYAGACSGLGATVTTLDADPLDEEALASAAAALDRVDTLVVDAAAAFAAGEPSTADPASEPSAAALTSLRTALDGAWNQARAVAVAHWVDRDAGGKIVLVAPRPDAGEHAGAVVAALENVARTLAIEWARHDVRATVLVPGASVTQDELDALVAYLASRAGDYFSGCRFDLGG